MKYLTRLCLLSAATFLWAAAASADTIASDSTTVSYLGYSPTINTLTIGPSQPTIDIGTGGIWAGPIPGSSWVSYVESAPAGAVTPANGTYTFETTFSAVAGETLTLSVLADDTTSVYLNGTSAGDLVVPAAPPVAATHCTMGTPNCIQIATFDITGLITGTNTLYFGVDQDFDSAMGLDFSGTTSAPTPEPSPLVLLGTGLIGAAGLLRRRLRA